LRNRKNPRGWYDSRRRKRELHFRPGNHNFGIFTDDVVTFQSSEKFTLGDRIQNLAHDILDDFIVAYYSKASNEKIDRLKKTNVRLERLRFAIRLSHDLKLISNEKYGKISERINTIGGTLGNWLNSLKKRR